MIEFLNTLDPVLLAYYLLLAALALLATIAFAYFQAESSFEHGFNCGKADLDSQIVKAESSGYRNGYSEGKEIGRHEAEVRFKQGAPKPPKSPVKQPSKPRNNGRTQSGQNKPKPAAKKPNPMPAPQLQRRKPAKAVKGK
jgi:predicted ribosomally synthesized peptide with SipW-like signal peptide